MEKDTTNHPTGQDSGCHSEVLADLCYRFVRPLLREGDRLRASAYERRQKVDLREVLGEVMAYRLGGWVSGEVAKEAFFLHEGI